MSSFSERRGLVRSSFQIEGMDVDLRNCLWNVLYEELFLSGISDVGLPQDDAKILMIELWSKSLKKPTNEIQDIFYNRGTRKAVEIIKLHYDQLPWNRVYDFIESAINTKKNYLVSSRKKTIIKEINRHLATEMAGYRIVNQQVAPIIGEAEIQSIEDAISSKEMNAVVTHLKAALTLLSDRKEPDYRNSVKESISAVEAMCKLVTGDKKATLGKAVDKLEAAGKLHPSLRDALSKLYGYTSDAGGIRHALKDDPTRPVDRDDAVFMLVICSAFVNYLNKLV